jgi:hypothetical protein
MSDARPGLNPRRLIGLMRAAIERCRLDLSGTIVLTEAASGAYMVTPVLAAMAGASRVFGLTRSTPYGSAEEITARTLELARQAGVEGHLSVVTEKTASVVFQADIVTNSGHVRPIDAAMVREMKPSAVISLMYEAWEFRPGDVDLEACRRHGIAVAGTNERHPTVNVFAYLGIMAVKLLLDSGVAVFGSRILILCDNPFAPFLEHGLRQAGAVVSLSDTMATAPTTHRIDAILVAMRPLAIPRVGAPEAELIAVRWPGAVVAQFWGDLDRAALAEADVSLWPPQAPPQGHMGILPSAVGPDPIVRLQVGGLKVAEVLLRSGSGKDCDETILSTLRLPGGEDVPEAPGRSH